MVDRPNGFDLKWVGEKGQTPRADPLTRWERAQVGKSRRLELSLADAQTVRWQGELLEALGRELQSISRDQGRLKSLLWQAAWAIMGVQGQIKARLGSSTGCSPSSPLRSDNLPEVEGWTDQQEQDMQDGLPDSPTHQE